MGAHPHGERQRAVGCPAPGAPAVSGDIPRVVLEAEGASLEVALLGATPLRWFVDLPTGRSDVLDGYRDVDELSAQDGVRNGIMAPFCNRVADATYRFDGATYDLRPGDPSRTIYHGLVRRLPFVVTDRTVAEGTSQVTLRCDRLGHGATPGYPFDVDVEVTYALRPDALRIEVLGHNVGHSAAPFTAGWHPYFRLPGASTIDRLSLTLPATTSVRTDADLIPLPGAAAYQAVGGSVVRWDRLDGVVLDRAYAGDHPGPVRRSRLEDPATGTGLTVWQERGPVHVFTGDTLGRHRRRSIAIEPTEVVTDAFNRPDCADLIRLEPGARRSFRFGVDIHWSVPAGT